MRMIRTRLEVYRDPLLSCTLNRTSAPTKKQRAIPLKRTLYPRPSCRVLKKSRTGPPNRAAAEPSVVATLEMPIYFAASALGMRSVAKAQLLLRKIPIARPIMPPYMSNPVRLWALTKSNTPAVAIRPEKMSKGLRPGDEPCQQLCVG